MAFAEHEADPAGEVHDLEVHRYILLVSVKVDRGIVVAFRQIGQEEIRGRGFCVQAIEFILCAGKRPPGVSPVGGELVAELADREIRREDIIKIIIVIVQPVAEVDGFHVIVRFIGICRCFNTRHAHIAGNGVVNSEIDQIFAAVIPRIEAVENFTSALILSIWIGISGVFQFPIKADVPVQDTEILQTFELSPCPDEGNRWVDLFRRCINLRLLPGIAMV